MQEEIQHDDETQGADWRQHEECLEQQSEVELLKDALDHIARVAGMARQPTKRLDWIIARARAALAGKQYDKEYLPSYPSRNFTSTHAENMAQGAEHLINAIEEHSRVCGEDGQEHDPDDVCDASV